MKEKPEEKIKRCKNLWFPRRGGINKKKDWMKEAERRGMSLNAMILHAVEVFLKKNVDCVNKKD